MSHSLYKCLFLFLSIVLILFTIAGDSWARGVAIPVFKKTPQGHFVWKGTFIDSLPQVSQRVRISPFDKPSRKDLLNRRKKPERDFLRTSGGVDTVRVMLFRISFLSDDKAGGLSSIYTGGNFDLTEQDTTSIIDPAPHNRAYFESHLFGLRNYYHFQSCGKMEIVWDVLPPGQDDSYKLSDIADYGPGETEAWTTGRIVDFLHACIHTADSALADEGYPYKFSDYDAIIMAHAGANMQSDVDYDTPNDIPSLFARFGDEDAIVVDGGETILKEIAVIPETSQQDGFIGGIAAVLAHEFGHALGLPDLYDIYTNGSSVGGWDLMDSGGQLPVYLEDQQKNLYYVEGLIPPGLSAWCREYLGWLDVEKVETFRNNIDLPAVEKCPARAVRVEAAGDEYFLIENRAAELDDIRTDFIVDSDTDDRTPIPTGVVIGLGNTREELVNGYDIILPTEEVDNLSHDSGPGILIWHIDQRLIDERWEANEVNSLTPLGVSLLEANGVVDLGNPYSYYGLGWWDDAYFLGNNAVLSDSTFPRSWSNWNVPTGVRVENISARDTLMHLGAGVRAIRHSASLVGDVDPMPCSMLALREPFKGFIVDTHGEGWVTGVDTAVFNYGDSIITPLTYNDSLNGGEGGTAVAERSGVVHLYDSQWKEFDGWPVDLGYSPVCPPVIFSTESGSYLTIADRVGYIHVIDSAGKEIEGLELNLNRVLGNIVVSRDSTGWANSIYLLNVDGYTERPWLTKWDIVESGERFLEMDGDFNIPVNLAGAEIEGGIALLGGDIEPERDGDEIYVVSFESGRILLFGEDGLISSRDRGEKIRFFPALQDVDGNTFLDLIYTDGQTVYVVSPSGANISGWPRTVGDYSRLYWETMISVPITVVSWDGGARVIAGSRDGLLFVYNNHGDLVGRSPRRICSCFYHTPDLVGENGGGMVAYYDGRDFKWRSIDLNTTWIDRGWTSVMGNLSRTSYVLPSKGWKAIDSDQWVKLDRNFIVYPNPSYGGPVNFRFASPGEGEARLEVLTVSGELVIEQHKTLTGGDTDEFVIDFEEKVSNHASGVYLSRLTVYSNGHKREAYRKFAIVR